MKHLKHLFAAALAMFVALAIAVPAFAAGETYDGVIKINTKDGQEYTLYKLFDATVVEGREAGGEGISYTLMDGKTDLGTGTTWFKLDDLGNVTAVSGADITTAAFKTWAEGYGVANPTKITGDGQAKEWTGLTPGYYYINTTTGSLVTVTSITPDVTVNDKNTVPEVDKKITGAFSIDDAGKIALAEIGTHVTYTAEVTFGAGSKNVKFIDTMGTGLTNDRAYTVTGITADQWKIADGSETDSGFTIEFADGIAEGTKATIVYTATVNSDALTVDTGKNTATVSYGDKNTTTPESTTNTYNAKINIKKQDGQKNPLAGAGFVIKNGDNKYYKLDNGKISWYTLGQDEKLEDAIKAGKIEEHISVANGTVPAFTGLGNGTYTLVESTVPKGYNKAADQAVTIKAADAETTATSSDVTATVTNQSGTELPSTGGIGTTIFYVVGGALVITAGVLLVTKRRMANVEA